MAPIVAEIKRYILSQPVIHCDETHVQVLSGTNKKPASKKSLAELFLTEIQKLFLIERKIESLSPLEKQNMRFEKASPIIQNIRKLIDENVNKVLPR